MAVHIIRSHLCSFSQRIASQLNAPTIEVQLNDASFRMPADLTTSAYFVLVPADILRNLPIAFSWTDVDIVSAHNAALRKRVNPIIGETWRRATTSVSKKDLRGIVLREPELLTDLLAQYREKPRTPYDLRSDPEALQFWYFLTRTEAASLPLDLSSFDPDTPGSLLIIVQRICGRFKELIENNRLSRLLYNDDGTRRREKIAQLALFGIADAYCSANNLDLSPEVDSGAGPVDFKISRGYQQRVVVEVKLTSNPKLVPGLKKQLPAYAAAEQSLNSIYLVIRNTDSDARIQELSSIHREAVRAGQRAPDILVVDGRTRAAASKL